MINRAAGRPETTTYKRRPYESAELGVHPLGDDCQHLGVVAFEHRAVTVAMHTVRGKFDVDRVASGLLQELDEWTIGELEDGGLARHHGDWDLGKVRQRPSRLVLQLQGRRAGSRWLVHVEAQLAIILPWKSSNGRTYLVAIRSSHCCPAARAINEG